MFKIEDGDLYIFVEMSSQLKNIDRTVNLISDFFEEKGNGGIAEIIQVTRELLLNAVEHGNRNQEELTVTLNLEIIGRGRVKISVTDQGKGVPEDFIPVKHVVAAEDNRRRGLALINTLADELTFGDSNNTVIAYMPLLKPFDWGVIFSENSLSITPSGDFSASNIDQLREIMFQWLDSEMKCCSISMKNVETIDSVSLSLFVSFSKHLESTKIEREFEIVDVSAQIAQLFRLTQISRLFTVVETTA